MVDRYISLRMRRLLTFAGSGVAVALGLLYFAALAFAKGHSLGTPTNSTFLDFMIAVAPGINLLLFAVLGNTLRRTRKNTIETASEIRKIHHSIAQERK